ncbi:Transposon Tf2-11 polyprotein [Eumeta japonica]|uniref:Transposon Tf2-11 polyprotein n=1 Tax=Eumeta variegata TaxID=151549 RepID=A0A4C1XPW6_EUMVA|nr:Transposon Tf2-11 polyprotein [Eumeta japonica]
MRFRMSVCVPFDAHFMIKRSVLPSAITSTARNSGPGRYGGVGSAGCEGKRTLIHGRCWQDNIRGSDGAGPVRTARARAAAGDSGASSVGGVFALKTATGGQGAPLESASSGGRRRAVDVRGAPLREGDARASHYLAAELAGDVEGNKKCYNIKCVNGSPLFVVVTLNRLSIECEVDSGSAVSAMSNTFYTAHFKHQALSRINGSLRCYDGSPITPRGSCSLSVTYRGRTKQIKFYIIDNGCHVQPAPILGRDFMSEFNLGISEMKYIDNPVIEETSVAKILMNTFPAVFSNKLGKLNKFKVQLQLKPDAKPIFFKPRPVPFALKPKVDEALDKLIETGILKSVNYSDYATPITPVLKSDGTVRVCGDYSVTLNKVLHIDRYPLPRIEELFARLHEGKEFSKLDLSMAYMQLELTEDSQPLTCINTHRGLFQLHDWFWVIVGACDISKTMERILAGIEGICFVIDKDGLHTSPGKVKAIKEAEPPKNVSQLKSFLGLVNYYRSFVPRMSTILGPLHDLLKMGAKWMWSEAHQSAFETVKRALESELALAHYDPRLSTVLTVDASPTGLGAVLAQQQEDGSERVIAFASRALTPSERVYSQIQKEATAIIFGVKKFHQYLYGIPEMTANRLQRYALFLSAYNYTVQYVRSANNVADYLSRSHRSARLPTGAARGHARRAPMLRTGKLTHADIEAQWARSACTALRPARPRATRALAVPARPWERVHLDMLSVAGGTHLVVVDAHSKGWSGLRSRTVRAPSRYYGGSVKLRPVSPAQLMLGRNVRTRLDLLCPRKDVPKHVTPAPSAANLAQSVSRSQISQSKYFGGKRKLILPSVIKL